MGISERGEGGVQVIALQGVIGDIVCPNQFLFKERPYFHGYPSQRKRSSSTLFIRGHTATALNIR